MKKWMCGVCGYSVVAEEPPEICPVCGADKKLFELIEDNSEQTTGASSPNQSYSNDFKQTVYGFAKKMIRQHHLHPISVHIPNGVVPVSFIFVLLSVISGGIASLEKAAFLNFVFVLLAMPAVAFTGYTDWKEKYSGAMTKVFKTKMICAAVLTSSLFVAVIWRAVDATAGSSWLYLMLNAVILGSAGIAGFMGGKLVFKD